ncbi:MAG: GAP family protein [Acidimicrobiia bacterium]
MLHTAWRVFLYGIVAATSPLALTTTLVVLRSGRPRINGLLYGGAFLAASTVVLVLVVGVGLATSLANGDGHPTFQALLALVFGVALLVTAVYVRRRTPDRHAHDRPRTPSRLTQMTSRIEHLGPLQAIGIGVALGIGGPKRLGITVLVAGTITAAGLGTGAGVMIGASYIVVGTVLVWLPVALYVVAGHRAEDWIATAQHWVGAHQETLTFYPSLVVGLLLVLDAFAQLA